MFNKKVLLLNLFLLILVANGNVNLEFSQAHLGTSRASELIESIESVQQKTFKKRMQVIPFKVPNSSYNASALTVMGEDFESRAKFLDKVIVAGIGARPPTIDNSL